MRAPPRAPARAVVMCTAGLFQRCLFPNCGCACSQGIMVPGRIDKARGFHAKVWSLAERMDWSERAPRRFWRWLLRRYDMKFGHHLEYDE